MSWERCPWCQQNLNGYDNAIGHYQREHPAEYRLQRAEGACWDAKFQLRVHLADLGRYDALAKELASGLPPLAHNLVETAMRKDLYRSSTHNSLTDREVLLSYVTQAEGQYRTAQEYLAKLPRG